MKIVGTHILDTRNIAYQLEEWPNHKARMRFYAWTQQHGLEGRVYLKDYYVAEMLGDLDYPAIQAEPSVTEEEKTMILLYWS